MKRTALIKSRFTHLLAGVAIAFSAGVAQATTLKIATVSPDGSGWVKSIRAAGKRIAKATDNRVKVRLYPGGVMGSNKAVMRKMKIGQLQGAALPAGAFIKYNPDSQIYNLPFTYRSQAEIDYVRKHLDSKIEKGFTDGGLITFGFAGGGFAYVMSKDNPIDSVESMRKQKVWIPNDDKGAIKAIGEFGVSPIPLAIADVLPSLQTGLINALATSPLGAIALQWHTQIKYMTDLPVLYIYATIGVSKRAFNKLSAQDQAIFAKEMKQAFKEIEAANLVDNASADKALKGQGVKLVTPNAEQLKTWREYALKARQTFIQAGKISPEIVVEADRLLAEYRAKHGQ